MVHLIFLCTWVFGLSRELFKLRNIEVRSMFFAGPSDRVIFSSLKVMDYTSAFQTTSHSTQVFVTTSPTYKTREGDGVVYWKHRGLPHWRPGFDSRSGRIIGKVWEYLRLIFISCLPSSMPDTGYTKGTGGDMRIIYVGFVYGDQAQ